MSSPSLVALRSGKGFFYNKPVGVGEGITAGRKEEESCMHK